MKISKTTLCLALLSASTACLFAGPHTIRSYTIDGGGGVSGGGTYALVSTIGQPDAGRASIDAPFTVTGGFWPGLRSTPSPGPLLWIQSAPGSQARVFWSRLAQGYVLEQGLDLNATNRPRPWKLVAGPYETNATEISVRVPTTARRAFFRLRGQ